MTGIGRLRALAYKKNFLEPAEARELDDIADQIEREQGGRVSRMRVLSVVTEMERHVSGVEGMEDSPVARWARELREALGGNGRDPAADVSVSAYDLLPQEDREAIAWVREHGGLDSVKKLLDWVVGHCSTKQQLDFDFWLSGRVMHELGFEEDMADRDEVEGRLLARLMPEGMEWLIEAWPKFEDDEPVGFGDEVSRLGEVFSISLYCDGSFALNFRAYSKGERVKRPAVLAADGEPLEVGQTVRGIGRSQHEFEVLALNDVNPEVGDRFNVKCFDRDENEECWCDPNLLTHQRPVLDADGVPIKVGNTVWMVDDPDGPYRVTEVTTKYATHVHGYSDEFGDLDMSPSQLTHERPDSLDRLVEDIGAMVAAWRSNRDLFDAQEAAAGCVGENTLGAALDSLARRAKALAGDA